MGYERGTMNARLLGGRYELLTPIASGGMGRVWRARDTLLSRPVAVKVVGGGLAGDPSFLARFRAEAQHAAMLNHPNIVAVHDYGEQTARPGGEALAFLVMELVDGESLAAELAHGHRLPVDRVLHIIGQTADALAAAHAAGLVHRDVKPGNILVGPDGTVKISDFGIAWSASSAPLTRTGQVVGTAHYLAPERAEGAAATPASDVYALGVVAYECLAGRRPFDGDHPVQIALQHMREQPAPLPCEIPEPVRALVERAMAKDPAARFLDGGALGAEVDRILASEGGASAAPARTAVLPTAALPAAADRRRGGRVGLISAAGFVALVLCATILATALHPWSSSAARSASTGRSATSASATPASSPTGIRLDSADYVGRPVTTVQAELTALGLHPVLAGSQTAHVPAGQVTAVSPTGLLAVGQRVTVTYAAAPPPPAPAEHGRHGKGRDHGDG